MPLDTMGLKGIIYRLSKVYQVLDEAGLADEAENLGSIIEELKKTLT